MPTLNLHRTAALTKEIAVSTTAEHGRRSHEELMRTGASTWLPDALRAVRSADEFARRGLLNYAGGPCQHGGLSFSWAADYGGYGFASVKFTGIPITECVLEIKRGGKPWLLNFSVAEDQRQRGHGRRAVEELACFLAERDFPSITIESVESAIPFWRANGFEICGRVPGESDWRRMRRNLVRVEPPQAPAGSAIPTSDAEIPERLVSLA